MRTISTRLFFAGALLLATLAANAEESMVQLDIGRGEARIPAYVMSNPKATATLILLPGGDAGSGKIVDGQPSSRNFLSRSRDAFFAANFNVIVVYRASDLKTLDYPYRISQAHIDELATVVRYAHEKLGQPVWLVGTSRGTVSGTAAAIALGDKKVQGLVLTSSITSRQTGAIATQNVASLKIPTLVVHHQKDACRVCIPDEASRITQHLTSAPFKKFLQIEGGANPEGDPCGALHWHGFIQYEKETVKLITDWIRQPSE